MCTCVYVNRQGKKPPLQHWTVTSPSALSLGLFLPHPYGQKSPVRLLLSIVTLWSLFHRHQHQTRIVNLYSESLSPSLQVLLAGYRVPYIGPTGLCCWDYGGLTKCTALKRSQLLFFSIIPLPTLWYCFPLLRGAINIQLHLTMKEKA